MGTATFLFPLISVRTVLGNGRCEDMVFELDALAKSFAIREVDNAQSAVCLAEMLQQTTGGQHLVVGVRRDQQEPRLRSY